MEYWDAYTKDFKKIEGVTLIRGEAIPQGMFHLVCNIIVEHIDGSFLLMQRDFNKHHGGIFELTAGGSAFQGEDPLTCAKRELKEETGIEDNLILLNQGGNEKVQTYYFNYLCLTSISKDQVKLQEGETISFVWLKYKDILLHQEEYLIPNGIKNYFIKRFDENHA